MVYELEGPQKKHSDKRARVEAGHPEIRVAELPAHGHSLLLALAVDLLKGV